jgi:hypothetical protein
VEGSEGTPFLEDRGFKLRYRLTLKLPQNSWKSTAYPESAMVNKAGYSSSFSEKELYNVYDSAPGILIISSMSVDKELMLY